LREIVIKGIDPCGDTFSITISTLLETDSDIIGKYGALQRIRELMLYENDENQKYDEIVSLCLDYQVPAKGYAAFVAVIENDEENVVNESMKVADVKNASGASETLLSREDQVPKEKSEKKKKGEKK